MSEKILSYRPITDEQLKTIKEVAPEFDVVTSLKEVDDYSEIKIVYGWNKNEVNQLLDDQNVSLDWIQLASAGVDYVDMDKLEANNVTLTSASGIHAHAISESIFGMVLNYTRQIGHALLMQRQSTWDPRENARELHNKTMLIVGAGEIGTQTGKVAQAFGMHTIGINRSGRDVAFMDEQYTQEELKNVLPKADVVVNILPLTDETEGLFNIDLFREMKKSAIFVNVGRGQTVVTDDLLKALDNHMFEYAALDVVHQEPLPEDHPIYDREDVLLTPHFSGNLDDYDESLFPVFEKNLKSFVEEKNLSVNVVDYKAGY